MMKNRTDGKVSGKIGRVFLKTLSVMILLALSFSLTGCSSREKRKAEKTAKEYAKQYKGDFEKAVSQTFGSDAELTNVEGKVKRWIGELSFTPTYEALTELSGIMKKDGGIYHVTYNFKSKVLLSDYYNAAIMDSLIDTLGLDRSKIIYTKCYDSFNKTNWIEYPAEVVSIREALDDRYYVEFYIATSEPLADKTFDVYFMQCDAHNRLLEVNIFSSENFSNLDHFKSYCQTLELSNTGGSSTVRVEKEAKDIFSVYNLKNFAALRGHFENDSGDGGSVTRR